MTNISIRFIAPLLLCLALAGILSAQNKLPDTPHGNFIRQFVDAFNSGDDAIMRKFFIENVSKEGLKDRPIEARVQRLKTMRSDMKSLAVIKVIDDLPASSSIVAKSGSGETLTLTFNFDKDQKFAGLGVEMGEQAQSNGPPMSKQEFLNALEETFASASREDKFSGAALIARDGEILFKKAYGEADKRLSVPNRTDTKFNLGSINKFFTRVAIAQLAEKGKLSLEERFITYLPDYPNKAVAENVTIQHLLDMKSGMGDFFGEKFDHTPKNKIRTLSDYVQFFVNDSLSFVPGTQRRYSNAGFTVLGLIIEKLTGQDYYSYVREHIFQPAGMKNTDSYASDATTPNMATGYMHPDSDKNLWVSNIHSLPGRGSSAGGGYSTLDDMHSFVRSLLNGKLLSPKYTEWMLTNTLPPSDPALPLKRGGVGVAGGSPGVNAALEFDAGTGNVVIVLSNYSPPSAEQLSRKTSGLLKRATFSSTRSAD